jgi:hypothetical protein
LDVLQVLLGVLLLPLGLFLLLPLDVLLVKLPALPPLALLGSLLLQLRLRFLLSLGLSHGGVR